MEILWLADNPNWAYAAIVGDLSRVPAMREHGHIVDCVACGPVDAMFAGRCAAADIVMAMYLRYVEFLPGDCRRKTVMMLTGMRPFET